MKSLLYEHLVKAAYNTERYGARGKADANVYRDMEHALREVELQKEAIKKGQMPISTKSIEDLEYEARVYIAKVRGNVSAAISEALRNTNLKYSSEEIKQNLKGLQSKLNINEYNKDVIDNVISEVWDIFRENKLA
ncbi:MAG: hypothetical protein KF803_11225 [Cyclobacteriaceae bacterium]|nr:hypothetical protein [Cyclobacteriaceae bacterium]